MSKQENNNQNLNGDTINPGDRVVNEDRPIEEKAEQIAVDVCDVTTEDVTIPTYYVVEDKEGEEKEALHHVKDAEEITDVIRQARVDENGERKWW